MGAIAASGRPEALEVFRTVLLSSAAFPAVFPPGFIKVDADGGVYDEMHVDGGATREVFLVPTRKTAWITTSVTYRAILSTPARKPPTPSI
jgi:predicted acylesterase/phospholipase RssA